MVLKRNTQIDGIRGGTSIIILVFHLFCRYLQIYEGSNIAWMEQWGTFGVTVFILISGYFLGLENIKEEKSGTKFKLIKYLQKKIIRLWIAYVIAITITMIITKITGLPGRECTWIDYILNIFFINGFIGVPYVDGAHWYLTTLISIIVVLGIIRKLGLNNKIWIFAMWLLIIAIFTKIGYGYITVLFGGAYTGIALTGFCIAKMLYCDSKKINKKWIVLLIYATFFCFIIQGPVGIIILFLGLLVTLPCFMEKIKLFENPMLLWLGEISYPLYLIHQNIGFIIIRELTQIHGEYNICLSIIASMCVLIIAIIISKLEKVIREQITIIQEKSKVKNNSL